METPKKRPGRPRTKAAPSTGDYIGFRIPAAQKRELESAAAGSGRSLSTEVSIRIEESFRNDRSVMDALVFAYGPRIASLAVLMADAMKYTVERRTLSVSDVTEDWRFSQALEAGRHVLKFFEPPKPVHPPVPETPGVDDLEANEILDRDLHIGWEAAGMRLWRLAQTGYDPVRDVVPDDWLRRVGDAPLPDLPREDDDR